ncbi:MAG: enoyl-ACP reductase FabI [Janthinobacterium sp.]
MPGTPFSLLGKRGLILGLANAHSIAYGCACCTQALGARLVLSCADERALPYATPAATGLNIPLLTCDVQQKGALERLVHDALAQLGGLDFVIHSIAWAPLADLHGRVTDSSVDGFLRAMDISCHSFARLARLCEAHMPDGGSLLTMSYLGAEEPIPQYGIMGPVKAALESLVRYLACELGPRNIRVHALSPGPLPTRAASGLKDFDALMERNRRDAPLQRLVTLAEIGQLAAFLAGDGASGMSGQTIYVDGGYHAIAGGT